MLAYVSIQEETFAVRQAHFNKQHEVAGAGSAAACLQHILAFSSIIGINKKKEKQLRF